MDKEIRIKLKVEFEKDYQGHIIATIRAYDNKNFPTAYIFGADGEVNIYPRQTSRESTRAVKWFETPTDAEMWVSETKREIWKQLSQWKNIRVPENFETEVVVY